MKALFIGGIKSGKSKNAEEYALSLSDKKPYYLATTEFFDEEMSHKVAHHKQQRSDRFITIEEGINLPLALAGLTNKTVLVECVSMWINNMLHHQQSEEEMIEQIIELSKLPLNLVFVINDVSCSVVSENRLVRDFIDISGRISQLLAQMCDEVYVTTAGIKVKIK